MTRVDKHYKNQNRWLGMYHGGIASTSQAATAGRTYLSAFIVQFPCHIDRLSYLVGATSNGNVTGGIYRAISEDTADGATLVVQSDSTAQGSTNTPQALTLATTYLAPGRYYTALEVESATGTFLRQSNTTQVAGWTQFFDQAYGTLPSTVPTPTNSSAAVPGVYVRVVQP